MKGLKKMQNKPMKIWIEDCDKKKKRKYVVTIN